MYKINTDPVLLDGLKQNSYINKNISIEHYDKPFNHCVINNLLNEDIYNSLCGNFSKYISRTTPYKDQPGAVHDYAGYIYGFNRHDCTDGYEFFIDLIWKNFCSSLFNIEVGKYTALSAHWHKAPSKKGFVHNDFNICSVLPTDEDGIHLTGNCYYSDDTLDKTPSSLKIMRSIALLYYMNNKPDLDPSDNGGTSIYTHWGFESFVKQVRPTNNSVFIFEVCPDSFHGFSGAEFDRSSMVQWFHSSPAYHLHRHLDRIKYYYKTRKITYERWGRGTNPWPIENDPEYSKYFSNGFYETLEN